VISAVLAADFAKTRIVLAVIDRSGKSLAERSEATPEFTSQSAFADRCLDLASAVAKSARTKYKLVSGGVSVGGTVANESDGIKRPGPSSTNEAEVVKALQKKLKIPLLTEQHRNAMLLGEAWKGSAAKKNDVVLLLAGTGIEAGVLTGGRLLKGSHGLSGNAAWMAVSEADGFEVRRFGGLGAFCSESGVVRAAKNAIDAGFGGLLAEYDPNKFTAADVATLAREGDLTARNIFRRAGRQLGLAAASLISLFDPEMLVLGGSMTSAADLFWDELTQTALARCHPLLAKKVQIKLSKLGDKAALLGAARLAWEAASKETSR